MYTFGPFKLDTDKRLLLEAGRAVAIEPQVYDVLLMLIENRQRVVMKDELIASIWKGRVVSDAALSSRIKSARQAVGDSGKKQQWIKTVHRLGFRFIGEVSTPDPPAARPQAESPAMTRQGDDRPAIIVLPFQTPAEDVASVFSLGFAHDIITSLSRLRWLKVIARASAFKLADASIDPSEIQSLVRANYCASGQLYRHRDAIEIAIQLEDFATRSVLWADRITFTGEELQAVRHSIVCRIVNALERHISEQEAGQALLKSTEDLNAWESYHRAMSHFFRFNAADNQLACELFRRSIDADPGFARAHAGLSSAAFQNAFNNYPGIDRLKAVEQAITHAEKSIHFDRMDPLANFVMGRVHWLTGEPGASLPWLERAVALNPNYAQGYYAHGLASLLSDDSLRGYDDSERALSLSPLDPFLYGFYGIRAFSYLADQDRENAHTWAEKAAHQPEALPVMDLLAAATSTMTGRADKALTWLGKARERRPGIDSRHFFAALPFVSGRIKEELTAAFRHLGI